MSRLPKSIVDSARFNPDAIKFGIRFIRPLDPLRDSFGDAELCSAHERTVRAINKLIELIKEA